MCFICGPSQQSPLHLQDDAAYPTSFNTNGVDRGLKISKSQKPSPPGKAKDASGNPGKYKVEFVQENGFKMTLDAKEFYLVEFHIHEASEHWINGQQHPAELHIVFQNAGERAVRGVMIDLPARNRPPTHAGLVDESKLPEVIGRETPVNENNFDKFIELNPAKWLPKGNDAKDYFRYEGSLTTPEYDENVSWLVFRRAIVIPKGDMKLLRQFFGLPARNPQPANRRYVLTTD